MKCIDPRLVGENYRPCGNCRQCRQLDQKVWATRILLESYWHPRNVFGTLTYSDDNVPSADGLPILDWGDSTGFIERIRYLTKSEKPLRYFLVGEYGSQTWRPHYHFVLFGHGLEIEPLVNEAWNVGFTQVGELTFDRSMYIANYCIKKMTRDGDEYLKGRPPEFMRCSTKPALGSPAVGWLADAMGKSRLFEDGKPGPLLRIHGDVFNTVRIEGRLMPLGRTLRAKLRDSLGISQDPRERAHQLGRYLADGEILDEYVEPGRFAPTLDVTQINTPWRSQLERQKTIQDKAKALALDAKQERQQSLGLTTGGRL